MAARIVNLPTPEVLRELLVYEPETGKLFWKERMESWFKSRQNCAAWNGKNAGNEAFTASMIGYRVGTVLARRQLAHRVAWAIYYGHLPDGEIDHINGARSDNRICNLRDATHQQNCCNSARRLDNTSGYKGVIRFRDGIRWQALIMSGGKTAHIGLFDTPEAAHEAYCEAAKKYHGEFARVQ